MPRLDSLSIETDVFDEEMDLTDADVWKESEGLNKERFNRYDVLQYPIKYVRGYLRLRFEIPRTYNDITVLPQGIIVAIPEEGHVNGCETGLYLCFDDHERIEIQQMIRQRPETEDDEPVAWMTKEFISLLPDTSAIPATLQRLSEEVNWSTSERTKFRSIGGGED